MITIQFRDHADALALYSYVIHYDADNVLDARLIHEQESLLKIKPIKQGTAFTSILIPVLIRFIMTEVEGKWMKEMIRSLFYYTDMEEQEQILSIARAILDGEKDNVPDLPHIVDKTSRASMIKKAFSQFLTESVSFSFESFLQFRLKEYRSRLLVYVERAIDEYKMEQEYQTFIDTLRNYIQEKRSTVEIIYMLYTDSIQFFDKNLFILKENELRRKLDHRISSQLELDSAIIEPLISLAPKKIHLFTNKSDDGIVRTIQNIFQERVKLYSESEFPNEAKRFMKQ